MNIVIVTPQTPIPKQGVNTAYLEIDYWNDYSFITMFYLSAFDESGIFHEIGNIKIGFKGQTISSKPTYETLDTNFECLPDEYFSVGLGVEFYQKISELSDITKISLLEALKDIAHNNQLIDLAQEEDVFRISLLRDVSLSAIKGQYKRVLEGKNELTDFEFKYLREAQEEMGEMKFSFKVIVGEKPSGNIHAIIGRNGVGKTTLLNGMIDAVINHQASAGQFLEKNFLGYQPINKDYFSSVVSVSFSAFDPFNPPEEQSDPSKGTCYFYLGLKKDNQTLKNISDIHEDFISSLKVCFSQPLKKNRWLTAIDTLESDENFSEMKLSVLTQYSDKEPEKKLSMEAKRVIRKMSSGHAIVLLTLTRLVATVEEKTLVLIDEPESHLHPPLLSAFIQALSNLLLDRNGVAIIATHSPVVLQEIPKKCVWKLNRSGTLTKGSRPSIETFGENVGVLTREVFGLEVIKSGFHNLLVQSVNAGGSYEEIVSSYNEQLGLEARALLKALVVHRDRSKS